MLSLASRRHVRFQHDNHPLRSASGVLKLSRGGAERSDAPHVTLVQPADRAQRIGALGGQLPVVLHVCPSVRVSYVFSRFVSRFQAKSQFKSRSIANNVEIIIPVPNDVDSPTFKASIGTVAYLPDQASEESQKCGSLRLSPSLAPSTKHRNSVSLTRVCFFSFVCSSASGGPCVHESPVLSRECVCHTDLEIDLFACAGCRGVEHQAIQRVSGVPNASTLRAAQHQRRGCARVEGPHPGATDPPLLFLVRSPPWSLSLAPLICCFHLSATSALTSTQQRSREVTANLFLTGEEHYFALEQGQNETLPS